MAGLALFHRNSSEFLRRYISVDKTWIYFYTPETKEQSKQQTEPGKLDPEKAKTVKSARNVMETVFWDVNGNILIDYLELGRTINGEYYVS